MKKNQLITALLIIVSLTAAVVLYFVYTKCTPDYMNFQAKTSFYQVTPNLDSGGFLYAYVSSERYIRAVEKIVERVKAIIIKKSQISSHYTAEDKIKTIDFLMQLFHSSGVSEIDGIGVSSIALGKELDHSTFYLHHLDNKDKGLIWHINGSRAHVLTELNWLPKHTVFANFSDFRIKALWDFVKANAENSKIDEIKNSVIAVEPMLTAMGVNMPELLDSISGLMGVLITLDPDNRFSLPDLKLKMEFPSPAMAMILQVKNDAIFNLIKTKLPTVKTTKAEEMEILEIPIPGIKLPFPVNPVIVKSGDLLFVASTKQIVADVLSARKERNGLILTSEFCQMKERMPNVGNNFRYLSPRLFETIRAAVLEMLKDENKTNNEDSLLMMELLNLIPEKIAWFSVDEMTPQGLKWSANHTIPIELMALAPALMMSGFTSAMALPSMMALHPKNKEKRTMADLKMFSVAVECYITDFAKVPPVNTLEELKPLLQPFYIKELPMIDAWGAPYLIRMGGGEENCDCAIASAGPDGIFAGWDQPGTTNDGSTRLSDDLMIKNGAFILIPEMKH